MTEHKILTTLSLLIFVGIGVSQTRPAQAPQQNPVITVDVDLALVTVTVTNRRGQYVQDLKRENFRLWEDRIEQEIVHFSTEDSPMTLGIIIDRSGSMDMPLVAGRLNAPSAIQWAESSAYGCLRDGLLQDEYFMIEFSDKPQLVVDFTNDMSKLRQRLVFLGTGGNTALWDAIYAGVTKMEDATHSRKALLVLTDGVENHSRYSLSELKDLLREQDVRIYFFSEGVGQLADLTGGRVFLGVDPCKQLQADLKHQYVIGYRPTNRADDGKWRDILVKTDPKGLPMVMADLYVRARAGYYADAK